MMHGKTALKFIDAKQAQDFFKYKNTQRKLYKVNSAIWFNKTCKQKGLTPKFINIRVNGNSKQSHRTKKIAIVYRLNQEIKFLHHTKRQINLQLYQLHLKCAHTWRKLWQLMDSTIEDSLQQEMKVLYKNLNKKLDNLQSQQEKIFNNISQHKFYKRTVNLTPITFTLEEMELLNKGLQLNIELPIEQYWNDLIIETEQAIRKLEPKSQDAYRLMAAKKLNKLKNSVNHNIHAKRL